MAENVPDSKRAGARSRTYAEQWVHCVRACIDGRGEHGTLVDNAAYTCMSKMWAAYLMQTPAPRMAAAFAQGLQGPQACMLRATHGPTHLCVAQDVAVAFNCPRKVACKIRAEIMAADQPSKRQRCVHKCSPKLSSVVRDTNRRHSCAHC